MILSGDSTSVMRPLFQEEGDGSQPISPLQLEVRRIRNKATARRFFREWHYLRDQDFVSQIMYGAYFNAQIEGAIVFGPPSAPETCIGLLGSDNQRGIYEIKRLAMSDRCIKNCESRFIAIAIRLMRKWIKVRAIVTYADTAQNHEGVIYKASGFTYRGLTDVKRDFVVNGKIKQRGKTKGVQGEWVARSQKHMFVKLF